jgi:hypothetical protein
MSDIGDKADVQTSHRERLQIADTVEKLFQGVRADRLIRQQTVWSNNDSNAAPSRFYYCGNVILEPRSPDFSTQSARSCHWQLA